MAKKRPLTEKTRQRILEAAAKGSTDVEIRKALKVSTTIWYRWLSEDGDLSDDMHDARLPALAEIEAALYKRAIGYSYVETTAESRDTPQGEVTVVKNVTKQLAPDVTAQQFILQNRRPDRWRPPIKIEDDGGGKVAYLVKLPE